MIKIHAGTQFDEGSYGKEIRKLVRIQFGNVKKSINLDWER